jgi:hypothetical protein
MSQENEAPDSAPPPPADESPAQHIAEVQKKQNFYRRVTSSVPLLVTVIVHLVLVAIAGAVVVQQNIGGKKKILEASAANEASTKQVEHRLQVARRGGASGGASSPVSATRIFSTAAGAVAMPEMPDLPSMAPGGFGGFGGAGSGVGMGAGSGMATSLGAGSGLGGRGFMSLSFLGSTSQNASNIVFVVDVHRRIMDPSKGGFRAFSIIREEIMRLVGRLPPSVKFNVLLFEGGGDANEILVNPFRPELVPATSDQKKAFFAWMTPVNSKLDSYGVSSAGSRNPWKYEAPPPESGIDPNLFPPVWARAVHAALIQKPDTIFVITSTDGVTRRRTDAAELARREAEVARRRADFERETAKEGLTADAVIKAREAAMRKAGQELAAVNRRLVAAGKDPIVVTYSDRIFSPEAQAALRRAGERITLDTTGWSKRDGTTFNIPDLRVVPIRQIEWDEVHGHLGRLQRHYVPERATINLFLFTGPDDDATDASARLTSAAKRNGGTFQLLTTKRLEELRSRDETK